MNATLRLKGTMIVERMRWVARAIDAMRQLDPDMTIDSTRMLCAVYLRGEAERIERGLNAANDEPGC
jgi:hypothetical protein